MAKIRACFLVLSTGLALVMSACATPGSTTLWAPRQGFDLAADKAACLKEALGVNMLSAAGYSDGRYGVAAAMAGRMDRNDMRRGGDDRLYDAIEDACMKRKGWTQAG